MKHSPTALRFLKAAMNADTDGLAGLRTNGWGCNTALLHN